MLSEGKRYDQSRLTGAKISIKRSSSPTLGGVYLRVCRLVWVIRSVNQLWIPRRGCPIPGTVKPRFTDTRLIRTSHYYEHFALSWGKKALTFFSKFNPLYTPVIQTLPLAPLVYIFTGFHSIGLSVELGFWIPIVCGIPDSLNCISDSKAQDYKIPRAKFSRIPILRKKIFWIPESEFPSTLGEVSYQSEK